MAAILVAVSGPALPDATTQEALRPRATRVASIALVLAVVGAALAAFELATRPPCYPGYVRLVDAELLGALVVFALVPVVAVVYWLSRRGRFLHATIAIAGVLAVFFVIVDLGVIALIVGHFGARYDTNCWSFG